MFGWKPAGEGGTEGGLAGGMEPFPLRSYRNGSPDSRFDAFSSREPVPTSLEIALCCGSCGCFFADCDIERIPLLRPMGRRAVRIFGRTSTPLVALGGRVVAKAHACAFGYGKRACPRHL